MIEVKWLGRGGQGVVTASDLLANAAYLDGYEGVQAFPFFGPERRGAQVTAFTRLSKKKIRLRSLVYEPSIAVILDPILATQTNFSDKVRKGGCVILNAPLQPNDLRLRGDLRVATVDAVKIAEELNLRVAGMPIYNAPMLGALSRATGVVHLDAVKEAMVRHFGEAAPLDVKAAEMACERTMIRSGCENSSYARPSEAIEPQEINGMRELPVSPVSRPTKGSVGSPTGTWREKRPILDRVKCERCLLCWLYCPEGVITVDDEKKPVFDYEYFKGCGICAYECRFGAISLRREALV